MPRRLALLTATILLALAAPASASVYEGPWRIGSLLTRAPDPAGFAPSGEVQALQAPVDSSGEAVPRDGVLTQWRLRSLPTAGDTVLQVLRPDDDEDDDETTFTVMGESEPVHVTSTDITVVDAQLPVKHGDRIAARSVEAVGGASDLGAVAGRPGNPVFTEQPAKTLGQTWTLPASEVSVNEYELLIQADIEPDADQDGKGDITQNSADLVLTGSSPAAVGNLEPWSMTYTVRNDGPDAARNVFMKISGGVVPPTTVPAGMTCANNDAAYPYPSPGPGAFICTLVKLASGASVSVSPAFITPAIYPPLGGTFATQATVSALTSDPNTTNNSASLKTIVASPPPYVPNIPPQAPFAVKPCANIIRGTRDDDVLRGTTFGDRLVGGDGDDLLKGQGADDCLEGGTGDDVLDGGDGNDRLAGSAGRDRLSGGTGDDKLTGGKGNDRLTGGPGNDTVSPGSGRDVVDAGGGNDTINSVDGVKETIDCGAGSDSVRADRRDRLKHCEKVRRR
ncbi:MAG: hypothetical protein ABW167_03670 [Baekduia sp.]